MVIQEQEFRQFAEFVRSRYGIHFKKEKRALVAGRLSNVLASMNMVSLSEYMDYVAADKTGKAASAMLDRITTNYTYFLREPAHFEYFQETVLPYLKQTVGNRDLRIWSAACATGEEPYTLAMVMDVFFGPQKKLWDTRILATDISEAALAVAKAGVYPQDKLSGLPADWRRRYFKPAGQGCAAVCDGIKEQVIFGNINLMGPAFPFKQKMHAIFCRNVMIYFDAATQAKLAERLCDVTMPGGFLFVGHAESLSRGRTRYAYVKPAVYRKE